MSESERAMKLVFHVQGSVPEPYTVIILKDGNELRATCDCQAGQMKQACKHRIELFESNAKGVVGGDVARVAEVKALLAGTTVGSAWAELGKAEKEEAAAKQRVKKAKAMLAKAMHGS